MTDLARIRRLLEARRPGHALPRAFYNDPGIFAFDMEAIYLASWLMAGFDCELPRPGSYLSLTIAGSPILLVRGRDGQVRGFHNSCRHRGAQLCRHGRGRSARITCPYHQWSYDLSGRLLRAAHMPDGFRAAEHGLNPIHVETVAGSLYVCLAADAPDFEAFRRSLEPLLLPQNMADAKLAHEITLVEKANWKLVMENGRECYHCAACHPELRLAFPMTVVERGEYAEASLRARYAERMEAAGLPAGPADGDWWQATRFPLNEGAVSMTSDGRPAVARPMVAAYGGDVGSLRWAIEPHAFAHAVGDHVFFFSALPVAPEETHVVAKWYVHKDAVQGVDYSLEGLVSTWDATNRQDRDLAENNQRGVNSVGFTPGPYSATAESLVLRFVDWYCRRAGEVLDQSLEQHPTQRLLRSA